MANSMLDEIRRKKPVVQEKPVDEREPSDNEENGAEDHVESDETSTEAQPPHRRLPDAPEMEAEEDVDVTVEMQLGGTQTTRTSAKNTEKPDMELPKRRGRPSKKADTVYVRDVPRVLVNEAKRMFPSAKSVTDAVTAFMAYKSGIMEDLTADQLALVRGYEETDPIVTMTGMVEHMESDMRTMLGVMRELELGQAYMIYDRLGFRKEGAESPGMVNFLENGVDDMVRRLRENSLQQVKRDRIRNGRPIR